jgi:hypothetical protein
MTTIVDRHTPEWVRAWFGIRTACSCGWQGVVRRTDHDATLDYRDHVAAVALGDTE